VITTALLLAGLLAVNPAAPGLCPELPAGSGLEWRHQEGPDFEVCYAHPPGDDNAWFGIYFGYAPSYRRKPGANDDPGHVGGHAVTWQPATGKDGDLPFGQEALFELDMGAVMPPMSVHVWINARTSEERKAARKVLLQAKFEASDDGR